MEHIIEKKNYSDQVFDYLFEEIKAGRMKPGDKLPNERDLSQALGVSRPSLREALRAMTQLGLVTTRHGGGTYINTYDEMYLMSVLRYITVISDDLLMDLIQVRKTLEAEATRLAAQNATEEDLKKIEHFALERQSLCARYRDDLKAVRDELNALDYDFHKSIAEASKNKVIAAFILSIHSTFTEHQNRVSARAQIADQVNKLHLEIVEALKKRDQKLAKTLMYEHLQMVEDSLSSVISAQKGS